MTSHTTRPSRTPVDRIVDVAARVTELGLAAGHRTFGRAELHVHAWRVGRDPAVIEWIDEIEREASDGVLADRAVDRALLEKYITAEPPTP